MEQFNPELLKQLYQPAAGSHKGQNGKLLVIGGSHLFSAASLWALSIASKIVDMVFYSSVPENNDIVQQAKAEFRNGIIVLREHVEDYVKEADCILIGPGMLRTDKELEDKDLSLEEITKLEDEGEQSYYLTKYLLKKYPQKKWVIDAGALQMLDPEWLRPLHGNVILTPHPVEFARVFKTPFENLDLEQQAKVIAEKAKEYNVVILVKGEKDVVCSPEKSVEISGGNAGMTKGGTGDVLAGLIASLACNNDMFLAAAAGSYINKKAGDALFEKVGYYFNSSDLVNEIPVVMNELLIKK